MNIMFSTVFIFQVEKSRDSANRNPDPAVGEGHVHITNYKYNFLTGVMVLFSKICKTWEMDEVNWEWMT